MTAGICCCTHRRRSRFARLLTLVKSGNIVMSGIAGMHMLAQENIRFDLRRLGGPLANKSVRATRFEADARVLEFF